MQQFIRENTVVQYEEVVTWNVQPNASLEYELFYAEVTDVDRYVAAIERVDSTRWHRITRIDGKSVYVFACQETRKEEVVLRRAFARLELVVVPPIVYDHEAAMEMTIIGEGDALRALVNSIPGQIDVTIKEIGEYDRPNARATGALTDRQFEVLRTALDLGYFEVPREASLAELATELGCAESTVSVTLRKAEAAIVSRAASRDRRR
ncbi:helix-turn-helix domain-containing protein [Halocatena salina]|uniref:Helix-turn-helix domain-containing protein n=1 Tax=Halocatena salina TaxID=2934340 RepID=A0A8U0A1A7_9EURY|nr:helix-turn-helix domain-containing protein [Halocatena salina]UPM42646.1 helix-turn-helix domain-containing protein [Halocatena salina]